MSLSYPNRYRSPWYPVRPLSGAAQSSLRLGLSSGPKQSSLEAVAECRQAVAEAGLAPSPALSEEPGPAAVPLRFPLRCCRAVPLSLLQWSEACPWLEACCVWEMEKLIVLGIAHSHRDRCRTEGQRSLPEYQRQ